jgi:hypothetical protein
METSAAKATKSFFIIYSLMVLPQCGAGFGE